MSKSKANARKMKHKAFLKKNDINYDPEEGTLSDDDITELEDNEIGTILNNEYVLIKYITKVFYFSHMEKQHGVVYIDH